MTSPEWSSHRWTEYAVIDATSRSPTIITLRATDGETTTVHKGLLIFFSKYFKAALEDPFAESTQITLGVDLSGLNLHRFKIWLYTGEIADPKHQEGICECANHVLLYIFADMMDILALRRKVMDYITLRAPLLPEYDTVRIIFTNLLATSPLRKHTLRTYIAHWEAGVDGKDEYAKAVSNDTEGVLKGFMEEFQRGVARRAVDHDVDAVDCACCGDACRYHEHESHAEWGQTCRLYQMVDFRLPANCLGEESDEEEEESEEEGESDEEESDEEEESDDEE